MSKRSAENSKRQVQGYKSDNKGLRFEEKVLSHFSQKGFGNVCGYLNHTKRETGNFRGLNDIEKVKKRLEKLFKLKF